MIVEYKEGVLRVGGQIIKSDFHWPKDFHCDLPSSRPAGEKFARELNKALWKSQFVEFSGGTYIKQFRVDSSAVILRLPDGWVWGIAVGNLKYNVPDRYTSHVNAIHAFELTFTDRPVESGKSWRLYVHDDKFSLVEALDNAKYRVSGSNFFTFEQSNSNFARVMAVRTLGLTPTYKDIVVGGQRVQFL